MIPIGSSLLNFIHQKSHSPVATLLCQTATNDGAHAATQTLLPKILSYRVTLNEDPVSNTCQLSFADDIAEYMSTNPNGAYAKLFQPGLIDNKFLLSVGFEGSLFPWPNVNTFVPYDRETVNKFTGFIETDANQVGNLMVGKTLSLISLTKQFRFPVNDTYPHPLYGDQTLPFFDPTYNLTPLNPVAGNATQWQCIGRMFTQSLNDLVYGSSHIPVAVYVDTTGYTPQNTAMNPSLYSFDYSNGIVTFTSGQPVGSVISLAGNPTYMAPETMIRKMLVELSSWSPNFLSLDPSYVLLPQFVGNGRSVWDCLKIVAGQTNPRFVPWQINADENGNIRFYESRVDSPPVRTFLQGHDLIITGYENSARALRTVVRADGTIYVNNGGTTASTQPVTSIAYNLGDIVKYGQTEPLSLSQDVVQNARPLTAVTAMSYLNMMTASVLAQFSRPQLTVKAQIWSDPSIQPGDKIAFQQDNIGMAKTFIVKTKTEEAQGKVQKDSLDLEEFYDSINYSIGIPSAVSTTLAQASITPPPSLAVIGALRMGSGAHVTYPLQNGAYNTLPNGDQNIPQWYASEGAMHFDVFLNSLPLLATTQLTNPQNQWDYYHLPPGYNWVPTIDSKGNLVYYGVDPNNSYTTYVGSDSVFYEFNHAAPFTSSDLAAVWVPPGNIAPLGIGGTQAYAGQTVKVYLWSFWYLCLDGSSGSGKFFRPIQRVNPSQDGVEVDVTSSGGAWVYNTWSGPPGPTSNSNYYGATVVGTDNHTTPPSNFVGANVMADGTLIGNAYGPNVLSGTTYVNYQKRTRGHWCILAASSAGQRQFLRVPLDLVL